MNTSTSTISVTATDADRWRASFSFYSSCLLTELMHLFFSLIAGRCLSTLASFPKISYWSAKVEGVAWLRL
jgi:hypothetical protein